MLASLLSLILTGAQPERVVLPVDGTDRVYDIYKPSRPTANPPLVFGFHGHGGNARNAARSFRINELWPEAVVVYMQGLPTPSQKVDPEGKRSGWQVTKGQLGDRDLSFFDAVYKRVVAQFEIDVDRVYAMGHSNGGRFTYLLMQQRGDLFAAFAPSGSPAFLAGMPAKPLFHIAGEKDPLVKFEGQRLSVEAAKKRNQCGPGKKLTEVATYYRGAGDKDIVAYFHPGGHEYPRQDGPPMIVEFFKSHPRKG